MYDTRKHTKSRTFKTSLLTLALRSKAGKSGQPRCTFFGAVGFAQGTQVSTDVCLVRGVFFNGIVFQMELCFK